MESTKWWLRSGSIQGALIAILPTIAIILKIFGVDFLPDEQDTLKKCIPAVIVALAGIYGVIKAIVGRVQAKFGIRLGRQA